jgi:hypothetical protein
MRSRGGVSFSIYRAYCAAGGNCGITLLVFGVCVLAQFVFSLGDYWMSYWYVLLTIIKNLMDYRTTCFANVFH